MTQQLSIRTILETPSLKTEIISGDKGINNPVKWAHVCELKDPTYWLSTNDLLMTTGIGIPQDEQEQRLYIQKLAKAQLSGIMIGENMEAPEDITALCEEAEQLGFPILITQYGVPFAAVTKLIVDANNLINIQKNNLITTLYEYARTELQHQNLLKFIKGLEDLLEDQSTLSINILMKTGTSICPKSPKNITTTYAPYYSIIERLLFL